MAEAMEGVASSSSSSVAPPSGLHSFDLDSYISAFTGHGRLLRLLFIARANSPEHSDEALRMGLEEVQRTNNVDLYEAFAGVAAERLQGFQPDMAWVESKREETAKRKEKLEFDVNDIKQSLIRESVRMAMETQCSYLYECGDLKQASTVCAKMKSYHTTTRHAVDQALMMVKIGLELDNVITVNNYANQGLESEDSVIFSCFSAAKGLVSLRTKDFARAAESFVACSVNMGSAFSDVISCQEVALFGGLCALTSFNRREIEQRILHSDTFKDFLEMVPHVRDVITCFHNTKYDQCLTALHGLREEVSLNMHLQPVFEDIFRLIREKALCQYTVPFVSVDLKRMASSFHTEPSLLMVELEALIQDGKIRARIDSHKMVLYATSTNQRETTVQQILDVGEIVDKNVATVLRSISAAQHKLVVRAKRKGSQQEDFPGDSFGYDQGGF